MATLSVYVCPGANQTVDANGAGACTAGQGAWQSVTLAEPFDPSMLNSSELAGAFGAGFVVMATGLVMVWAAKQVMRAIRQAL